MLRIIAALVLGAILLPAAGAFAADGQGPVALDQTGSLYLGQVNAPQVDSPIVDQIRDHDNNGER